MTLSYEDAMTTLEAMFGDPWNRQNLDPILRHHKGCMEAAVESVLAHGNQSPESLLTKLQCGEGAKMDIVSEFPPLTEEEKQEARELFGLVGVFSVDDNKLQATHDMKVKLAKLQDPEAVPTLFPELIQILKQLPYVGRVALILHGVKPSPVRIRLVKELLQSCFDENNIEEESMDGSDNNYVLLTGGHRNLKLNLGRYPILRLLASTAGKLKDAGVLVCEFCLQRMSYQGIRDNNLYKGVRHDLIRLALLAITSFCGGASPPVDTPILTAAWRILEDCCGDPELEIDSAILILSPHWKGASKTSRCDNSKDLVSILSSSFQNADRFVQSIDSKITQQSSQRRPLPGFMDVKVKLEESRKSSTYGLKLDLVKLKSDASTRVVIEKYRKMISLLGEKNENSSIRFFAEIHSCNFNWSSLRGMEDTSSLDFLQELAQRLEKLLEEATVISDPDFFTAKVDSNDAFDVFLPCIMEAHELKVYSTYLAAFSVQLVQQKYAEFDDNTDIQHDFVGSFRMAVESSKAAELLVGFLHRLFRSLSQTPLCQLARLSRITFIISETVQGVKQMFTSFEPISVISDRDQVVDSLLFGSLSRYCLLLQQTSDFLRSGEVFGPSFEDNLPYSFMDNPQRRISITLPDPVEIPEEDLDAQEQQEQPEIDVDAYDPLEC